MAFLALAPLVGSALAGTTAGGLAVASVGVGLIGAGVSAYGMVQQGKAAKAQANYEASEQEYQSTIAGQNAIREAQQAKASSDQLAKQRDRSIGAQFAAASASGLTISGSVINVAEDSAQQVEEDMAMIDYQGRVGTWNYSEQSRSLMGTAAATRVAGKNAYASAKWGAVGTMVKAVGQAAYSGFSLYSAGKALDATRTAYNAALPRPSYVAGTPSRSSFLNRYR